MLVFGGTKHSWRCRVQYAALEPLNSLWPWLGLHSKQTAPAEGSCKPPAACGILDRRWPTALASGRTPQLWPLSSRF